MKVLKSFKVIDSGGVMQRVLWDEIVPFDVRPADANYRLRSFKIIESGEWELDIELVQPE